MDTSETAPDDERAKMAAADMACREKILHGEPLHFDSTAPEEHRTIHGEWIAEAARKGKRIDIRHALIRGHLDLRHTTCEEQFSLVACYLLYPVHFSHATFKRNLILFGTVFHQGAVFKSTTVESDTWLDGAVFLGGDAVFMDLHVRGILSAQGIYFANQVFANFNRARLEKTVFFRPDPRRGLPPAVFEGKANFGSVHFGDQVHFEGAVFRQEVSFSASKIAGSAFFGLDPELGKSGATFGEGADFTGVEIGGDALFQGAQFAGKADFEGMHIKGSVSYMGTVFKENANFLEVKISRGAFFRDGGTPQLPAAVFERGANFMFAEIGGNAEFAHTRFTATDAPIIFDGVLFRRSAIFHGTIFGSEVRFTGTQFVANASFQGASFGQQVSFNGAKVHGGAFFRAEPQRGLPSATFQAQADFTGACFSSNAEFDGVVFESQTIFAGARFSGTTSFRGAKFNSHDKVTVFDRAKTDGAVLFAGARFAGGVRVVDAYIHGQVEFQGAVFGREVDFSATKIAGSAFFIADPERKLPAATLEGDANFLGTSIDGAALFDGVCIQGVANFRDAQVANVACFRGAVFKKDAIFNRVQIGQGAFFRAEPAMNLPAARFEGDADFTSAQIGSDADFREAVFQNRTSFANADIRGPGSFHLARFLAGSTPVFNATRFLQGAFFQGATFNDEVDFRIVQFDVKARFDGVRFRGKAQFEGSHFAGLAQFSRIGEGQRSLPGAIFSEASFDYARFERDADFEKVVFQGPATFRETSFRFVRFSQDGTAQGEEQFQGNVDLRGCTYEHIQVRWPTLLRRNRTSRVEPFDRQPYTQLEKVLRKTGEDRAAEEVYLERRCVERQRKWQQTLASDRGLKRVGAAISWFLDWAYWRGANYGIRPYRLIVFAVIFLALGTMIFSTPGAVSPKDGSFPSDVGRSARLEPRDAFAVTLHQFLPIEVPVGSGWIPSQEPVEVHIGLSKWGLRCDVQPSVYATFFLRLPGWILFPLGLAGVTGLLRRVAP